MTEISNGLRPNQQKAITALASGATVEKAALVAGVTDRTVYNWRTDEAFKQALQDASDSIMSETVTMLTGASVRAVSVLIEIAEDIEAPQGTRVSAARAILDATLKVRELYELQERVSELEQRMAS